jgi:hypothetical protein
MWNKLQPVSGKCIRIAPGIRQQCHSYFLRRFPLAVLGVLATTILGLSHLKDNAEAFLLNSCRLAEPYNLLVRADEFLVVSLKQSN